MWTTVSNFVFCTPYSEPPFAKIRCSFLSEIFKKYNLNTKTLITQKTIIMSFPSLCKFTEFYPVAKKLYQSQLFSPRLRSIFFVFFIFLHVVFIHRTLRFSSSSRFKWNIPIFNKKIAHDYYLVTSNCYLFLTVKIFLYHGIIMG